MVCSGRRVESLYHKAVSVFFEQRVQFSDYYLTKPVSEALTSASSCPVRQTKTSHCYRRGQRKYQCCDCTRATGGGEVGRRGREERRPPRNCPIGRPRRRPDERPPSGCVPRWPQLDKKPPECRQRRSGVALSIDPANRRSIRRRRLRDGQLTGAGLAGTVASR